MKKIFTLISVALLCLSASAQVNLATAIEDAVKASSDEYCSVFLDHTKEYVLDSNVDLGLQKAVIWGCGAKVTVKGEGQLSTQTYLQVRSVNFLCAEATKAIIALSATPDESLKINDETSAIKFEGANQKVYWIDNQVSVILCNFVDLGQSLIYANKQPYALANLKIDQCVVQLRGSSIDPVINWVGSSTGAIKNIVLSNNTIYNVSQDNTASWMIRFGNASNAQPKKVWGTDAFSRFQMYNNTICFPGKALANNFPNKNNVYLTWKKNIFINTPYLQKTASNAVREFTNADNVLYATEGFTIDNTDKEKYGTVEDLAIVPPTESLNIDNIFTLKNVFAPKFETTATNNQFGDSRWVAPFNSVVAKTPGYGYQVILGPDMLTTKTKEGKDKPAIDDVNYKWITYINPTSTLDDGTAEVQQSNRWTDLNPTTGERGTWLQATGKNGSVYSPVLSPVWGKYMVLYVKDLAALKVFATGSASSKPETKVRLVVKAMGTDGTVIEAATAEGSIYGKGTASDVCQVELNPEIGYMVEISATAEDLSKADVQITGLQLHGVDTTPFPVCHAPGEKAPGTNYEVVLGPDMLAEYALVSDPATTKPGINVEAYPWITYTRGDGLNALENGQYEAQQSNRWTDLNPTTGEKCEFIQVTGKNGSVNSPVISAEWNKWMEAAIMDATSFRVYATGSASSKVETGEQLILTATANDGTVVKTATTPGTIWGKGKGSDCATLKLDPSKAYVVKIEGKVKDIQITGFNITGTDLSIAPVEEEPGMGDATGIENVETAPVQNGRIYNVLGQEVKTAKGLVIKNGKKYIVR